MVRALVRWAAAMLLVLGCGGSNHPVGATPTKGHKDASVDDSGPSGAAGTGAGTGGQNAVNTGTRSCGNGRIDGDEQCDDGNTRSGDGCDSNCNTETGFHCVTAGAACEACGNGIVESSEACDDGNRDDGDGCDSNCALEGSWVCPVPGEHCELCGNGIVEPNEHCDDGNAVGGDGCAADCRGIDPHFACPTPGEACVECGDGMVQSPEVCDDGNVASGDGCVFNCSAVEPSWRCPAAGGPCTLCGDGKISGDEQCDDGNFASGDGCSKECELEPGGVCFFPGVLCSKCGNGFLEFIRMDDNGTPNDPSDDFFNGNDPAAMEQCDDGNMVDGDGCSSTCTIEHDGGLPWQCPLPGYACARCGDGVTQEIEACDNGRQCSDKTPCLADSTCTGIGDGSCAPRSGDGCTADCTGIEAHYLCTPGGGKCVACGNGIFDSPLEQCDDGNVFSGDGCDRLCQIETNAPWVCPAPGQPCELCGNRIKEAHEVCDDGNTVSGDGCSADCKQIELHYNCFLSGSACAKCGDGVLSPGEHCDEGDLLDPSLATPGCNDACQIVPPWTCPIPGTSCVLCGDGVIGPGESCEDGNIVSGDGCSSVCQIEPGYDCSSGTCLASACGDGFVAGNEECDDGNHLSGDGCSFVCDVEAGWTCAGSAGCRRTVCGDGVVDGAEQCDDGNTNSNDGCSSTCQFEPGYYCPVPSKPCQPATCGNSVVEGYEQCDDGNAAPSDGCSATCRLEAGWYCPTPGQPCQVTVCGDGMVQGLEQCDDHNTATGDGCDSSCHIETFYRCSGAPSACKPIIQFVSIQRFNISQVSPAGLNYEPDRRAFAGHKTQSSQAPIELCLDGTIIDPTDHTYANGTIFHPDGTTSALPVSCSVSPSTNPCYNPPLRPVSAGTLVGSTYDPFTDHYLFVTVSGGTTTLTDVPRNFDSATQSVANFQVNLSDLSAAADLTVGEDGALYIADSSDVPNPPIAGVKNGMVKVFPRRRDTSLQIIIPDCATSPQSNCTSFQSTPVASAEWSAAADDKLSGLFNVPGEKLLGVFNAYQGAPAYTGTDLETSATFTTSEYFSFFDPTLATKPPLYGRSALPGLLFTLGQKGASYAKYSQSAETAADGGSFIICPENPSEDCQLFARTCSSDAECAGIVPGTKCELGAATPYCHSPGDARDDAFQVQRDSTGSVNPVPLDVLANDSMSESACVAPGFKILSVCGDGVQQAYELAHPTNCPKDTGTSGTPALTPGGQVTYDAPNDGKCGFVDTFTYTVDLGGGVVDTATVRVVVACVCGDGVVDSNEQCDQGAYNAAPGTLISVNGVNQYARCGTDCLFNVFCGDGYIVFPEQCDDGNTTNGDGCSAFCTLESVCGNGKVEGAEECDDGNTVGGDQCNPNCTKPTCGDGNVDVQIGETCDDGNLIVGDGCDNHCQVEAICGNKVIEGLEQCDDGNRTSGDGCSASCQLENVCGNNLREGSEQCDGGDHGSCPVVSSVQIQCTNATLGAPNICICANYCGDFMIGGLEECDDGPAGSTTCRGSTPAQGVPCSLIRCGDGVVDPNEQCDDGNTNPGDGCTNDCKIVSICGNGIKEGSEQCDDGNNVSGDGCSSACMIEATVCGNGVLEFNEQCDDGNTVSGDGCSSTCLIEGGMCGNGKLDLGEECDDGNTTSGDGCSALCMLELCGNGMLNSGEQCDDGNRVSGDGCSALCRIEVQ